MARIGRVLIGADEVAARVRELGDRIAAECPENLLVVAMLKGGFVFLADLLRRLGPSAQVDFLGLARYAGEERPPGAARILKDLETSITGRDVMLVEDVVDTGLSISFLVRTLAEREPASLRVCTLLDRAEKRLVDAPIAYSGFNLGDEYVVGYGLDFLGLYRNVPCLVAVDDLEGLHADPLALAGELREWGIW